MDLPVRRHEISRLEAFSDAMFGFAATLLVVSLEVPRSFEDLTTSLWGFIPFGLSFAALVLMWSVHAGFFNRYHLTDSYVTVVNAVLMFLILFYVYPLKFMCATFMSYVLRGRVTMPVVRIDARTQLDDLFVIYGIGWVAIFFCVALLYRHAARSSEALGLDEFGVHDAWSLMSHYVVFVMVGLISITLAVAQIGVNFGVPGYAYSLMGPLGYLNGRARAKKREELVARSRRMEPPAGLGGDPVIDKPLE